MLSSFEKSPDIKYTFHTDFVNVLSYHLAPGYKYLYTSSSSVRINIITKGYQVVTHNGKTFTHHKNQTYIIPPYARGYIETFTHTESILIELSNQLIQHVIEKSHYSHKKSNQPTVQLLNDLSSDIEYELFCLARATASPPGDDHFLIDLHAQKLVYDLLQHIETRSLIYLQSCSPINKSIAYIKNHLNQPQLIKECAEKLDMTASNFSHHFKAHTGLSPVKYIRQEKMEQARELLLTNSVTDTAFELGYETPSYFISVFKKTYGHTPKQYQSKFK